MLVEETLTREDLGLQISFRAWKLEARGRPVEKAGIEIQMRPTIFAQKIFQM